jgi:hypothetical protein
MIREVFKYFFQPSTQHAKKLGYAYESIAIQSRYKRQQEAWQPHINHCYKFFMEMRGKSVIILGSGALIDIPMDLLVGNFEKIYLIDVVHPRNVLSKYKNSSVVKCITMDVTGLDEIFNKKFSEKQVKDVLSKTCLEKLPEAEILISCNLLSQLALKPVNYIAKNIPSIDQKSLKRKIQAQHLSLLENFPGRSYLVTDIELAYRNSSGQLASRHPTVHIGLPITNSTRWTWSLAPKGEISNNFSAELGVVAGQIK